MKADAVQPLPRSADRTRVEVFASDKVWELNHQIDSLVPKVMADKVMTSVLTEGASEDEQQQETTYRRQQFWNTVSQFEALVNQVRDQVRAELGSKRITHASRYEPY